MAQKKVVVVRHGQKKKNNAGIELLTRFGMLQIEEMCRILTTRGVLTHENTHQLLYSGAERTLQCATIAKLKMNLLPDIDKHSGFHFEKLYNECLGGDYEAFQREFYEIATIGGNTIARGLEISEYVRRARKQIIGAITEVGEYGNALVFSHSPIASFGAPETNFPYDIEVGDAVIYTVSNGVITSAEHVTCTL